MTGQDYPGGLLHRVRNGDPAALEVAALGKQVRALRKARGWSQETLAQAAGCDRQSINRLEMARFAPTVLRVIDIARALEVPPARLFENPTVADYIAEPVLEAKIVKPDDLDVAPASISHAPIVPREAR